MAHLSGLIATLVLTSLVGSTPIPDEPLRLENDLSFIRADTGIDYRLPGDVVPSAYKMLFIPEFVNFTFSGESEIKIDVKKNNTEKIVLHAKELEIESVSIIEDNTIAVQSAINTTTDFLILTLNSAISAGKYTLKLKYKGKLNDELKGFYRSSYVDDEGKKVWLATTQFEPTYARYAFPCWDEPALKATFDISIKHSIYHKAVSNMHKSGEKTDDNDITQTTTTFARTPPMSPYLVAFIVSDFESLHDETFSIWARKNAIKNGKFALETGKKELKALEEYTGITHKDHGFNKMDSFAIPDFAAGAMENWGLVTYRESALLVEENVTTTVSKQSVAAVISHEFTHQWFGNWVSPLWWKYTWLNEGFAEYFQWVITDKILPNWRLLEQQVIKSLQSTAFVMDSSSKAHPMNVDVNSPTEIKAIFDGISYQKAGSVIRMIRHILGEKKFQTALQDYLKKMKYSAATSDNLFEEFVKQFNSSTIDFKTVLDNWANTPGFPVVTVTRNYSTGVAILTQERYLYQPDTAHKELYFVPINYATQEKKDFESTTVTSWLKNINESTTLNGNFSETKWVIFNKQHFGYYRLNYDKKNWELITNFLNTKNYTDIHVLNRAQLIDDAMNLARIGRLEHSVALKLLGYLKQEVDYVPWYSAFTALSYLQRVLANTAQYGNFKSYILELMDNLLKHVTYEEQPNDEHVHKYLRIDAINWACTLGLKVCRDNALKKLTNWMNDPKIYKFSPDLQSTMLCAGVRSLDQANWNKLLEKQLIGSETSLIAPLGCTSNKEILKSYLTKAIDKSVEIDRDGVFSAVISGSEEGVNVALDFLIANKETIKNVTEDANKSFKTYITNLGLRINTKAQLDKLQAFIKKNEDLKDVSAAGLTSAADNTKWLTAYEKEFVDFFPKTPDSNNNENDSAVTFTVSLILFLVSLLISQM